MAQKWRFCSFRFSADLPFYGEAFFFKPASSPASLISLQFDAVLGEAAAGAELFAEIFSKGEDFFIMIEGKAFNNCNGFPSPALFLEAQMQGAVQNRFVGAEVDFYFSPVGLLFFLGFWKNIRLQVGKGIKLHVLFRSSVFVLVFAITSGHQSLTKMKYGKL